MPIDYEIDRELGIIRTEGRGVVTEGQLMAYLNALLNDSEVPHPIHDLHDLRGVDEFGVTPDTIQEILRVSQTAPEAIKGGRVAIVASDDLVFGMSRMLELLAENEPLLNQLRHSGLGPEVSVFREYEPARVWLLSQRAGTGAMDAREPSHRS